MPELPWKTMKLGVHCSNPFLLEVVVWKFRGERHPCWCVLPHGCSTIQNEQVGGFSNKSVDFTLHCCTWNDNFSPLSHSDASFVVPMFFTTSGFESLDMQYIKKSKLYTMTPWNVYIHISNKLRLREYFWPIKCQGCNQLQASLFDNLEKRRPMHTNWFQAN